MDSVKLKWYRQQSHKGSTINIRKKYFIPERNCLLWINIKITFENTVVSCPHCFSDSIYRYGKDKHGHQKYICRKCNHQFTLEPNQTRTSKKGYPKCPVCGRNTFAWHKYDSYIHFKCNSKKSGHSIKVPFENLNFFKKNFPNFCRASFKRFRFAPNIILYALVLYFENSCSFRQIQKFLKRFFSVCVSHVSIYNWIRHFASFFKTVSNFLLQKANLQSDEWHADETYIKINGIKHYLWILLDSETRVVIAFHLSAARNSSSALALFENSRCITESEPNTIITDGLDAYNVPIMATYPKTKHHVYTSFSDVLSNNLIESFNKTFKAWYKTKKGFCSFTSALDMISNFLFYYNFIHCHSSLSYMTPASVAGITYSQEQAKRWFLF